MWAMIDIDSDQEAQAEEQMIEAAINLLTLRQYFTYSVFRRHKCPDQLSILRYCFKHSIFEAQ